MELKLWEQKLLDDLKVFEGLRLYPYNDHLDYATIGYGHLIAKRPVKDSDHQAWQGFKKEDAERLLLKDMLKHNSELDSVLPWVKDVDDVRKTVLYGMAFQMGVPGLLGFVNTLKAVREKRFDDAANGMLNSLWAKQTKDRAKILAGRMRTGKY